MSTTAQQEATHKSAVALAEAARQITMRSPHTAIVILSMHSDESYVLRALKAGARGYLLKDSPESDLINAILAVHEGKAFFSPAISACVS